MQIKNYKNIYLKFFVLNKNNIQLNFYNKILNINLCLYILKINNNLNIKLLKKFLYENGLKNILLTNHFKIGLKYNYILNLLK